MSYIGAEPSTAAFPFDQFSGTGAATSFTLTYAPAGTTSILVAISGVTQNPNLYSVIGTTLTFSPAPPAGTNNISVLYLGLPVIGSTSPGNTAFLSATDLTATAGQTVFASAGSYTPGFVQVYRNGARLGNADFTATNGTTITLANAATAGDLVTIEYYTLTSLVNALPLTGGTVTGSTTFNTGVNLAAVSGNVGVGTSSPTAKLDVIGGTLRVNEDGAGTKVLTIRSNWAGVDPAINVTTNNALLLMTNNTERARIDSSGNVGVGTSSPAVKLDVSNGTMRASQTATSGTSVVYATNSGGNNVGFWKQGSTAGSYGVIAAENGAVFNTSGDLCIVNDASSKNIIFANNGAASERMRINSSGNLLVGTASTFDSVSFLTVQALGGVSTKIAGTGLTSQMSFFNDNGRVGYIGTSGTTTSYSTSSDYRLKEAVAPMTGALARNALLNPVFYKWKVDGSEGEGFIADQLQGPFPNAVTGEKDAIDADGKPIYQGIGTGPLDGHFAACVNELQDIITALTARITALESK